LKRREKREKSKNRKEKQTDKQTDNNEKTNKIAENKKSKNFYCVGEDIKKDKAMMDGELGGQPHRDRRSLDLDSTRVIYGKKKKERKKKRKKK
jgi:hypothetical protein